MSLVADAFNPRPRANSAAFPVTPNGGPLNQFWYQDASGYLVETGISGIAISAETMLNCGTVLAAVRFRGNSWAICSPSTFKSTSTGRAEQPDHYSQLVLRNPNAWQTGFMWRQLNGVWLPTWGNAYNRIIGGPRSFAQELRPMHPAYVQVVDQRADGSLVYRFAAPGEDAVTLGQEQVLHFRDLSTDGISGIPMYRLIRNIVGIALLIEQHAATFLRKGSRVSGFLTASGPLDKPARKELRDAVNEDFGGTQNTGTIGIIPYGVTLTEISKTNREAQFMELADNVVGAILRFLGVPGFVIGYQGDKANTYASAKETSQEALRSCVLPIIENIEEQEEKSLLPVGSGLQIKHNLDTLLRVNTADRYAAHFKACGGPWMTRNEVRRIEDLNEDPNPEMDEILTPSNMAPELQQELLGPQPPQVPPKMPTPGPPPPDDAPEPDAKTTQRLMEYAVENAARVVRREIQAFQGRKGGGLAAKHSKDQGAWETAVDQFYSEHVGFVAAVMRIEEAEARAYCSNQAEALRKGGVAVMESWERSVVPRLAALGARLEVEDEPAA